MKLFFNNQVDIATVSSDDANINYPATNVQDTRLSRFFRGEKSVNFDITGAGGIKHIYKEFTNEILDGTDLTTGNWSRTRCDVTDSGQTINGEILWKLTATASGLASFIVQNNFAELTDDSFFGMLIKKGNVDKISIDILGLDSGGSSSGTVVVEFSTQIITLLDNASELVTPVFLDAETVIVYIKLVSTATGGSTVDLRLLVNDDSASTAIGDYTYYSQPIVVDNTTTAFPFVDGTHSADVIDETFTMPDKFTLDMIIEPRFAYDTTSFKQQFSWFIDASHELKFLYNHGSDKFNLIWDEANQRTLESQAFNSDGSGGLVKLNQRVRVIISLDLTLSGSTGSRLIVIPLELGSLAENINWNGNITPKVSDYTTLSIGHTNNTQQADADFEYFRIYEGLLVGAVASSEDVTELLKDKKILLDKTYMKRLTATDLLIAKTTINAGDTITLRANDVDSFGAGSPVDESIDYDGSDILLHTFEEASYQYWRLIVNSSNVIDIGRVFLGLSYESPVVGWDVSHSYQSTTKKTRTPSLNTYGDIRPNENLISLKWPKILTATDKPALITFFDQVDISEPFFIIFDDGVSKLGTFYVTIDTNGLHFVYYKNTIYSKAAISFIEEKG